MNFDFSEQQKLIQSEARRFLREQCSNELSRQVMNKQGDFDSVLWKKIVDLDWLGLAIPEEFGGLGLGYLELCVLSLELGRSLAPIPYSSTVFLFAEAIKMVGSTEQKEYWLPRVAKGDVIGCAAIAEQMGDNAQANDAVCRFENGVLSGIKIAVTDGEAAHVAVVSAITENAETKLYLVELNQAGVTKRLINSLDPSRPQAILEFDQVSADVLELSSLHVLGALYNCCAVLTAFEQVGGCEAALKMGMAYTKQRYAFGRSVASFQAIKHKFADMYVAKEIALANAYYGAWALASNADELGLAAATARVSAGTAYFECSRENLQAHGGMGYTWEFDCHLHYRRAQHLSLLLGGELCWKDQISDELLIDTKRGK